MEAIEPFLTLIIVILSAIGTFFTWWYRRKKFKEYKEAKDAEENFWNNKDLDGEI